MARATLLVLTLFGAVYISRNILTQVLTPPIVRQGVLWEEWLKSPEAGGIDSRLKDMLATVLSDWRQRGVGTESFGVLRPAAGEQDPLAPACYPFEKEHAAGRAVDVWVGDVNQDQCADLTDVCLFAATLEGIKGGCGVYGRQALEGTAALWVHVDVSGTTDCWGEWRTATGEVQPVLWSKKQRSARARCVEWGLVPNWRTLALVISKQPSAFVFGADQQRLSVRPSLRLYVGELLVKAYPVALGLEPIGDKEKRGDFRTPEGDFYICEKSSKSQFHKALRLSYPNVEDADRGLRDRLINRATYSAILGAIARGKTPPQNTTLGGDIMLHGGGAGNNWTGGCIALENQDVDELFELVPLRTRVKVLPASGGLT